MIENTLKEIKKLLQQKSTVEAAAAFKKLVPGHIKIWGVRTPELDALSKAYKHLGFALLPPLWNQASFEERIIAIKILQKIAKQDAAKAFKLVQQFAPEIDNWAVCDAVGMQALQTLRTTHTAQIFALAQKYNASKNFWERRLSLVLVEWYTRHPIHHKAIYNLITPLENDEEYYVKKAVVWIKKNFEKGK